MTWRTIRAHRIRSIIILDEADSMTADAQSALRRTMETYSGVTRFCLICNYVTRIIDPLASRCSKFRFKALDASNAIDRLRFISEQENVKCDDGVLERIDHNQHKEWPTPSICLHHKDCTCKAFEIHLKLLLTVLSSCTT